MKSDYQSCQMIVFCRPSVVNGLVYERTELRKCEGMPSGILLLASA